MQTVIITGTTDGSGDASVDEPARRLLAGVVRGARFVDVGAATVTLHGIDKTLTSRLSEEIDEGELAIPLISLMPRVVLDGGTADAAFRVDLLFDDGDRGWRW